MLETSKRRYESEIMDGQGLVEDFFGQLAFPEEEREDDLTSQMELLKKQADEKDKEIENLKQEVGVLRQENRAVKASLNSKTKEISALKKEIKKLHAEKKELENRVTLLQAEVLTLNAKVGGLNKEVTNLKEENGELKGDNLALVEEVDTLTSTVTDMQEQFQSVETENARLSKEINNLKYRRSQEREVHESRNPALESPNIKHLPASLILGEMCLKVQSLIYQKVLPKSYHPKESYQVKYIDEDISTIEDEQERKLAAQTWENIQKEVEWDTKLFTRTMKSIQVQRNFAAHPKLTEASLLQAAKLMNDKIYGDTTYESVKKMIGIWKKLVDMK